MRRLLLLPALTLALFACGDDTSTGGGGSGATSQGGEPSTGGNREGGNHQGGTPSNGGGGSGQGGVEQGGQPQGGEAQGGQPQGGQPQGGSGQGGAGGTAGDGGAGGAPPMNEDCNDGTDNDGDNATDCADTDCALTAVCGHLVINEVDYDQISPPNDAGEFVEIFNAGTTTVDLGSVQLLLANGGSAPPALYRTVDLSGTLAPGEYAVVADPGVVGIDPNAIVINFAGAMDQMQNGATDAAALYDVDYNTLLDAVSYEGTIAAGVDVMGTSFDFFETTGTDATDSNTANASIIRSPNGADTDNNQADWALTTSPTPGSANTASEICDNTTDDDGDNLIDCADSDCIGFPACVEICDDTIDNNGNSLVDCQEASCDTQDCDAFGRVCTLLACTCPGGATETNCADNQDNDCDGDFDCADSDCAGLPLCTGLSVTGVDYPVIAHGGRLVISGAGFTGATNVTIGGVTETGFVVNSDTQITIPIVLDTTPIGASQPLVVTVGAASTAPFNVAPIRLQINELDSDSPGTDVQEFIEVSAGVPNVSLAGYTVVLFNAGGAPFNGTTSYLAYELGATTDVAGLVLSGNAMVVPTPAISIPNGMVQNGPDAAAIYQALPAVWPNGTTANTTGLIDALVYDTADADANALLDILLGVGLPGRVQVDEGAGGAGGPAETQSVQRCGAGRLNGLKFIGAAPPTPGVVNTVICP